MNELECPYCKTMNEPDHDDGYGYSQDELHQQECNNCGFNFIFQTTIHFSYETKQAKCLNGEEHTYKLSHTYPRSMSKMVCEVCDHRRELTRKERLENEVISVYGGTPPHIEDTERKLAYSARLAYEKNCILKYDRPNMNSVTPKKGESLKDYALMFGTTPEAMKEILPEVERELKRLGLE